MTKFVRDVAMTMATSVLTIVALVAATRMAATGFGPEGFGAYMLSRRILATLEPLSTAAMGTALTRALAREPGDALPLLSAGFVLATLSALTCFAAMVGADRLLAEHVFQSVTYIPLVRATAATVLGYSVFTTAYSWYRGSDRMAAANGLQFAATAIGPAIATLVYHRPGQEAALVAATAVFTFAAGAPVAVEVFRRRELVTGIGQRMALLARYSWPRIIDGLSFTALLALAPFLVVVGGSLRDAAFVAVGQLILRVVEAVTEGLGRVALPAFARMHAGEAVDRLADRVGSLVAAVFHISTFVTLQLLVFAPLLTSVWLGPDYAEAGLVVRLSVLAILPYMMFVTLRSVLDAIEPRPVNTVNLMISVGVAVIASAIALRLGQGARGLTLATSVAFTLLGALTLRSVVKRCSFSGQALHIQPVLVFNIAALAVAIWVAGAAAELPSLMAVATVAAVEAILALAYAMLLRQRRVVWVARMFRAG